MDSSIPVHSHNPYHGENFPLLVLDVKHKTCFPSNEGFLLPHWHEEVQFVYVLDGEVHLKVYQEEVNLKKGDCVFLNCMVLHHITGKSGCHYHSYIIPPKMLSFFPGSAMEADVETILNNPSFTHFLLLEAKPENAKCLKFFNELDSLYFEKFSLSHREYRISVKLAEVWLEFLTLLPPMPSSLPSRGYARIRSLLSFIHTNFSHPISARDIAASAHISQTECVRCFQAFLGESPYQYLMKYRLHASAALLTSTEHSITEIALDVGFRSSSSYIRYFKEVYGMTPLKYRMQSKKRPESY